MYLYLSKAFLNSMDSNTEEKIKSSFLKVKDHMEVLESEIKANREFISAQNDQIQLQNQQISTLIDQIKALKSINRPNSNSFSTKKEDKLDLFQAKRVENDQKKDPLSLKNGVSIGNEGVSLDGYSLPGYSLPGYSLPGYSLDIHSFKEQIPLLFSKISRQEFLTFLTIYQQEEELGKCTYNTIAQELKITPGCIRTYVSGLIKKGIPIIKTKYNNKLIILAIPDEIKGLNMKKKLIQIYYNQDPSQRKLGDSF
jgi:hypothetical protein